MKGAQQWNTASEWWWLCDHTSQTVQNSLELGHRKKWLRILITSQPPILADSRGDPERILHHAVARDSWMCKNWALRWVSREELQLYWRSESECSLRREHIYMRHRWMAGTVFWNVFDLFTIKYVFYHVRDLAYHLLHLPVTTAHRIPGKLTRIQFKYIVRIHAEFQSN